MKGKSVVDDFSTHVDRYPQQLAVVSANESLTYSALDERSNKLAAYLQARNIGRGDFVMVQAHRSVELVVALLAIAKSGAAFVPLDRTLPQKRKEYIAAQCNAALVLSTHDNDTSPLHTCDVMTVSQVMGQVQSSIFRPVRIDPSDLIYVIFTSGTTGAPKGVMIEHQAVVELMRYHNNALEIGSSSRITLMAAVGFDVSQSEIWSSLIAGGCIYILDEESLLSIDAFLAFCVAHQITHAFVPTLRVYDLLSAHPPEGLALHCVYTAGEKLHPVEVDHVPYKLIDYYGPTEATIFVTSKQVESKRLNPTPSIGFPIGECGVHILADDLCELPSGEVGELCISGTCLARGYLGAAELTAERFVHSPALGRRVYRSGDRARRLPDGSIQFLGRIDGQVKIRGYRVELGEIEARLSKESEIKAVAVVVEERGAPSEKNLVAFFVPLNSQAHAERIVARVRRSIQQDLPEYMLPVKYYRVDELPVNSNGKVDKRALIERLQDLPAASLSLERFSKGVQKALAGLWFKQLGHPDFGPEDGFFDVGGHSLKVAEMAAAISRYFQVPFSIRNVYEYLVFKDLADELERRLGKAGGKPGAIASSLFENDARLEELDLGASHDPSQMTAPGHIFLTGATGFVGVHLLERLLATSSAQVHCPLRCESPVAGKMRLRQVCQRYEVAIDDCGWGRIHVHVAELSEPGLGMDRAVYASLASQVDLVYHSASLVNFITPYSYMRKDNVEGLRNVIAFCAKGKVKPLMLMSTISVYSWGHRYTGKVRVLEQDSIDENLPAIRQDLGYVQSKWVMEKIADLAALQGLPLMTFRLGYATFHSQTGVCASYQWWGRFIQTCLRHNAIPDLENLREGLTTVDYMTQAVAHISRIPAALGSKFNLCQSDGRNLTLREFCERVGRYYGQTFRVLPFHDWVALWETDSNSLLYPLLAMFKEPMCGQECVLELYQNTYLWDCSNTHRFLEGSGIAESNFDQATLGRYLDRLARGAAN